MKELNIFAKRILQLRNNTNMTQEKFAKKINVSRPSLYKYENALCYPNVSTLITISKAFDVSIDYLIGVADINARSSSPNKVDKDKLDSAIKLLNEIEIK